ncbi:MAG: SAM-dependent methyltransferase, partial [Bacteroidota bacterium]
LSDAGCPAVADPGAEVVAMAHQSGIPVVPLIGPSSILLSLMGSGLNGQSFAFNGYLPVDPLKRKEKIKQFEQHSLVHRQTQNFIETPNRNQSVINDLFSILHPSTKLCIAAGLTSDQQYLFTDSVSGWKSKRFTLDKVPAVLLFLRE